MSKNISIRNCTDRLLPLLELRYAGFAAWEAFRLGDYETSSQEPLRVAEEEIALATVERWLEIVGMSYNLLDDFHRSVAVLTHVHSESGLPPIAEIFLADSLWCIGSQHDAIDLLNRVRATHHNDPEVQIFAAGSYADFGHFALAADAARNACQLDPLAGEYFADYSYYNFRCLGLHPATMASAWKAVHLEPDIVAFRVWLSTLFLASSQPDAAYHVLRNVDKQRLREVDCECCLRRLRSLFERFGDHERYQACNRMLDCRESDIRMPTTVCESYILEFV